MCLRPRQCLLCGQLGDDAHATDCAWRSGSPAGHQPHLPAQAVVLDAHTHRPGHAVPNPAALFQQLTDAGDLACMVCAAVNTYEQLPHPGTQPGHRTRCTTCGTHQDTIDRNSP